MASSDSDGDFNGFDSYDVECAELKQKEVINDRELDDNFDDESDIEIEQGLEYDSSGESSSENDDFEDILNRDDLEWSQITRKVIIKRFSAKQGPTNFPNVGQIDIVDGAGDGSKLPPASAYFDQLIPNTFWETLKLETNRYSSQNGRDVNISVSELKTFIGITMLMGLIVLPSLKQYWSSDPSLNSDFIRKCMSRDRYFAIQRDLHLTDSTKQPAKGADGFDRLYKVRPMIDMCKKSFREQYDPPQNISIDEGMVKYKGRLGFVQYMPMKPTKRGIKVWIAAASDTGYVHAFNVYTGKSLDGVQEKNLGHKVVMDLMETMLYEYRHVYFDNFFTSIDLAIELLNKKTYCCGTIRSNRKYYPLSHVHKLAKGSTKFIQSNNLIATAWQDKKTVHILSTNCDAEMLVVQRRTRAGIIENVSKPLCIINYNKCMGGVDLGDQLRQYYSFGRTSLKWWRYLFYFLLNVACVNSFLIYKLHMKALGKTPMTQLEFRHSLAKCLIGGAVSKSYRRTPKRKLENVFDESNISGHSLVHFSGRKRVCVLCSASGKRAPSGRGIQSSFGCNICSVNLCKTCFPLYHASQSK
ncbi:piggyBac transposable element-derived protein 4 [Patella vulgata]|uniref:piggyBac transposable element-derived protein 4 n=1 Tax=Patella vulgata TaxID=6465 RepID=UPI0024A82CBD|nr:piggyBac transposable element-derived protein 4 [Patella vulgata]